MIANASTGGPLRPGLRANLGQFSLLVLVNAFVGAMVGMERAILPAIADREFHLTARTAILSFIVVFGVTKAATNYLAGRLSDAYGRKLVLVVGWVVACPVPLLLMWAPTWGWVLAANVLLGVSQGLTWSTTVIMKVDLSGPKNRGLAMGLNEFAGYFAVAGSALATGYVASAYGLRPHPFYLGVGYALVGLGALPGRVRCGRARPARDRVAGRDLPGCVGRHAARDRRAVGPIGRKWLIVTGIRTQAAGIGVTAASRSFAGFALGAVLLGVGTAMVYPTLLAAIGDVAHPAWRGSAIGVDRLWRDLGYAFGALIAGVTADVLGLAPAIWVVAGLTFTSGVVAAVRMTETMPRHARA